MLTEASKQKISERIKKLTKDNIVSLDISYSVQTKDGIFQCVIKYHFEGFKKWVSFWVTTGIRDVGGNNRATTHQRRLANKEAKTIQEYFLNEVTRLQKEKEEKNKTMTLGEIQKLVQLNTTNFDPTVETKADWDFFRFMKYWVDYIIVGHVEFNTYQGYHRNVYVYMQEYFTMKEHKKTVKEITAEDLEDFYNFLRTKKNLSNASIVHYNNNISSAFQWLLKKKYVRYNPRDLVTPIKVDVVEVPTYSKSEVEELMDILEDDPIELPALFACFYGLRRSEILGIRIQVFDFEKNYFVINHVVLQDESKNAKQKLHFRDKTKSKKGYRTLPLFKEVKDAVLKKIERIKKCQEFFGNRYNHEYDGYLFVHDNGNFILPNYFSKRFGKLVERFGLKKITPHGLRHTNATLLHMEGVDIRDLQDWLGHQSIASTNRYTRSDYQKQLKTAKAVKKIFNKEVLLGNPNEKIKRKLFLTKKKYTYAIA